MTTSVQNNRRFVSGSSVFTKFFQSRCDSLKFFLVIIGATGAVPIKLTLQKHIYELLRAERYTKTEPTAMRGIPRRGSIDNQNRRD
jgi:hypothetical protein